MSELQPAEKTYFAKWAATARCSLKIPGAVSLLWTFAAAFIGIGIVSYLALDSHLFSLFAPLGASAVLLYGAPAAPFSQPRSVIGGHVLSAYVGVIVFKLLGATFIAVALGVSLAIIVMLLTKTVHPPAGATALIGVTASGGSFIWPLTPVAVGALILLVVALLVNNLDKEKSYPVYWF